MTKKAVIPEEKIWDKRMFLLMESIVDDQKEGSQKEFLKNIGFNPANLHSVKSGQRSFTIKQFYAACQKYNVSMDWFMGFTNSRARKVEKISAIELLKQAVSLVEAENLKKKRGS